MQHNDSTVPLNADSRRRSLLYTDPPHETDEPLFLMYVSEVDMRGGSAWHWLDVEAAKELRAELSKFISNHEES